MLSRLALLLALVVVLAACGEPADAPEAEGAGVLGQDLTVVATVYALASLAEDIAPAAEVRLLTASGQDPHDLELSPTDRRLIESADVVLYMGDIDFQPQVETAISDADGQVVAAAEVVGDARLRDFEGHSHAEEDGHGHDSDDETAVDPHLWLDAAAMAEVAEAVGAAFAAADPDHADGYRLAAKGVHVELVELAAEIQALLSDCAHDTAIVSHEAYAYLLAPHDLEQEGVSGAGGHGDASPQRLAELTDRIRAEGIGAVLAEPAEGRGDAEALANEAGVDLIDIDPLEIGPPGLRRVRFPDALRTQAQAFATALECA